RRQRLEVEGVHEDVCLGQQCPPELVSYAHHRAEPSVSTRRSQRSTAWARAQRSGAKEAGSCQDGPHPEVVPRGSMRARPRTVKTASSAPVPARKKRGLSDRVSLFFGITAMDDSTRARFFDALWNDF